MEDSIAQIGYTPSLALFEKPFIDTGVLSHKWIQHQPVSQTTSGVVEFCIPGSSSNYINLKCCTLQITGKLVDEQGHNISETDSVSITNAPLHSLWRQVDISLQNKVINANVGPHYAHKAYLDLLLDSTKKMQDYQFTAQLFYKDQAGQMDNVETMQAGLLIRKGLINKSKIVQLEGPLCLDLCEQDRYILNSVPINIKLWPNKDSFYIMTKDEKKYKFQIESIFLNVCLVEVSPGILVGHDAALKIAPAVYPYFESRIIVHDIAQGSRHFQLDNFFQGAIPSELLVGLVSSEAYNGHFSKNPFNFQHYNCNYIGFYINGESIPKQPFQPRFKKDRESGELADDPEEVTYTEAYLSLFGNQSDEIEKGVIKYSEYPNGYCLYKFKINHGMEGEDLISFSKHGLTRLTLGFNEGLREPVNIVIYARFPCVMRIDDSRKVVL